MKDVIALAFGFICGSLITAAFGGEVRASIAHLFTKIAAKIGPKS